MKTLYHGTSSINLACIQAIGIVPGHAKGGDAWAKEHHWKLAEAAKYREPSVFIADAVEDAENFAKLATEEMGGDPIVITLHVPAEVFETFVVDELFDGQGKPHAWRAHSIEPNCIGEVIPVKPRPSDYEVIEGFSALLKALLAERRHF